MQHSSWVFYSGTNFFLPPAPNYLVLCYSYPFLKLSSFSLADSTKIWLADRKCLGHTYMPCISQLGVIVLHSSPAVAAARKEDLPLWLCEAGGREGSRSRSRDLAEPASGLTELLLSKVFFCTLFSFCDAKEYFCQKPFSISLSLCSHCSGWGMNT